MPNQPRFIEPIDATSISVVTDGLRSERQELSLPSRQRDGAVQGLVLVAENMAGADFRTLLNTFNDQWVEAARFLSPPLLIELLRLRDSADRSLRSFLFRMNPP